MYWGTEQINRLIAISFEIEYIFLYIYLYIQKNKNNNLYWLIDEDGGAHDRVE